MTSKFMNTDERKLVEALDTWTWFLTFMHGWHYPQGPRGRKQWLLLETGLLSIMQAKWVCNFFPSTGSFSLWNQENILFSTLSALPPPTSPSAAKDSWSSCMLCPRKKASDKTGSPRPTHLDETQSLISEQAPVIERPGMKTPTQAKIMPPTDICGQAPPHHSVPPSARSL